MRSWSVIFLSLVVFISFSGCSEISFYWQAASGHLDLLNRKQDIQELLNSSETAPELRRKLKLVESVRSFAVQQMSLPKNEGYTGYVELGRPYVTMVVTAAPALELKAFQWCYWFVGCQEYRGYFDEEDALSSAKEMEQQKFDVSVGPVTAYSTLGWLNKSWLPNYFSDPVLSTFLLRRDVELIAVLIHELAHQVVYVSNDTSFNESFAVFVEQEGLRQYLTQAGDSSIIKGSNKNVFQWYLNAKKDRQLFRQLVKETFEKMENLFALNISNTEKLQKKQQIFIELRKSYELQKKSLQVLSYDAWFKQSLNNTHLLGVQRYQSRVEKFALLFEQQERKWPQFFEAVRGLAELSVKARTKHLDLLN
ncbi:MAG: aminopeptidase [SAR324 cluster bacterium]|nr:aminopeptidase [SAR324 cluster bacterium]